MVKTAKKRVYQRGRSCTPGRTELAAEPRKTPIWGVPSVADLLQNQGARARPSREGIGRGAHMRAFDIRVGIVVASLTLATAPAFAQRPSESGGGGGPAGAAAPALRRRAARRGGGVGGGGRGGRGGAVGGAGPRRRRG